LDTLIILGLCPVARSLGRKVKNKSFLNKKIIFLFPAKCILFIDTDSIDVVKNSTGKVVFVEAHKVKSRITKDPSCTSIPES